MAYDGTIAVHRGHQRLQMGEDADQSGQRDAEPEDIAQDRSLVSEDHGPNALRIILDGELPLNRRERYFANLATMKLMRLPSGTRI